MSNVKPVTLTQCIIAGVEARLIDLHVAIPAEVLSYNSSDQTAKVQIAIDRSINGKQKAYPILDSIPVVFPRAANSGISFLLEAGDGVLLVFSERNLDQWRSSGPGQIPLDARKFDLADAVIIPGLFPDSGKMNPTQKNATEMRGKKVFVGDPNEKTSAITTTGGIGTQGSGKPLIKAPAELDLLEIISSLIDLVDSAAYGTTSSGGGIDPSSSQALQDLKSDLEKLKV